MERKYTVTIRMVDTKEQIVVEQQHDSYAKPSILSNTIAPSITADMSSDQRGEGATNTDHIKAVIERYISVSLKQKLDIIAHLVLFLSGLAYIMIYVLSFIPIDDTIRAKLTLAMAIFSFMAGALSWLDIYDRSLLAEIYKLFSLEILVLLLVLSIIIGNYCYDLADAEMKSALETVFPNALTWVAILDLYYCTYIRQRHRLHFTVVQEHETNPKVF